MSKKELDTRTNILKSALQLFFQKGYKDVSYQDLVKETGLSKGAIYHYFASKNELLTCTFEFLIEVTTKPIYENPENHVKDIGSFKKKFIDVKIEQITSFKEVINTQSIKVNKPLLFLEAINENPKVKALCEDVMKLELAFLENCFTGLQKHNALSKEKNSALLAKTLYWVLQGAEMQMFFLEHFEKGEDIIMLYSKTIDEFFSII